MKRADVLLVAENFFKNETEEEKLRCAYVSIVACNKSTTSVTASRRLKRTI